MTDRKTTLAAAAALAGLLMIPTANTRAADDTTGNARTAAAKEPAGAHASGLNKLTDAEKQAGFKLLFDGKTADGWRNYGSEKINPNWKVQDGALVRAGGGAGDIVAKDQYEAFELLIDYRITPGGNSGIMFHVVEDKDPPYASGPEIQIQDNQAGRDPQKSGWLYQLYPAKTDATKPAGEWNTLRILIAPQGETSEIHMNGVKYAEFAKGSADWDAKVQASKFGKMPKFGKATKGFICLQDHGDEVAFRNIKVRVIEPKAGTSVRAAK